MTAPLYTDQALAEAALRKIGALDFGQSAPAEQTQVLTDKIPGLLDDLTTRGIYLAGGTSEIATAAQDYVAACLAYRCRDEFGLSGEALARVTMANQDAESKLRTLSRRAENPDLMRVDRALQPLRRWGYRW